MSTPSPLRWPVVVTLWLVVIGLAIAPILLVRDSDFGGADAAAETAIGEIAPDYEPWVAPLFEPPGSEIESLLFAVQAGIGGSVIGYVFGVQRGRRQRRDR